VAIRVLPALLFGAVSACAPVSSFRPAAGLMPGTTRELGVGATVVTPRPYVAEPARAVAHVWFSSVLGERSDLTGLVAFDDDALALGGAVSLRYLKTDRFAGGGELEVGYAWAALSAPLSLRVFDQTHVYVAPRLGTWGLEPIFGVPVGLSARIYEGFIVRAEWQRSWQGFAYYNRRDHFGVAGAYDF
jgi:hypothetical protein